MESPFATAKTIRDIGSGLPVEPYDPEEHKRASNARFERTQAPLPASVKSPEYFNGWMADLEILELEIAPTHVTVTVDLDDAQGFANALGEALDRDVPRRIWPVELRMSGVGFLRAVGHDLGRTLADVAVESRSTQGGDPVGWLTHEWFYSHGDRLGWVAETWGFESSGSSPTVHLLVECAGASVVDRRPEVLTETFGPAVLPLWQDALKDLAENGRPRAFWLPEDLVPYLQRRLTSLGLKPSDFRE